jgi:site-specific DNA-methyltransferase (adenine-specific)
VAPTGAIASKIYTAPLARAVPFVFETGPKMLERVSDTLNVAQRGDALVLLQSLADGCSRLAFFDPQHRGVLNHLKFGNEGARQRGRAALPAMSEEYIDSVCIEIARVLAPSAYLMRWIDTFGLCEGHHLRVPLKAVDLIAWDSLRIGMGKRSRRRGDYLLICQKPPIRAGSTWKDHGIPSRWPEKVDRNIHPHIKPIGLIERLIAATTEIGDLIVDPAAGSFVVMHAAIKLGRNFVGCDLMGAPEIESGEMTMNTTDLPPVAAQLYEAIRQRPGITPTALRATVGGLGPPESRTALHIHIAQLNRQLAPYGIEIRSAGGGYSIRSVP